VSHDRESGLNIAALARRTGVPAHTLRKWEQRYGVLHPARTAGGQRRYDEADVARITWLRDRLRDGYRISEAAALLAASPVPARTGGELREALAAAVAATDAEGIEALLDQALALLPLGEALEDVVRPALVTTGERWERGEVSVAQEHLLSAAVRARIIRLLAERRPPVRGRAVLACAPGERHELGLLMLAALLCSDGWGVAYLGAETPAQDALAFAEATEARLLCLSVTMPQHVEALVSGLSARPRGLHVILGGAVVSRELARLAGARYVGDTAVRAVPALERLAA
jgi:methanogenic corrinoid protein MtbC1